MAGNIKTGFLRVRQSINEALSTICAGFEGLCTRFCDSTTYVGLVQFLEEESTVEDFVTCIFSPVKDYQDGALQVIGQVYDVVLRDECLRSVFKAHPERACRALINVLSGFSWQIDNLLDACEFAKSLVRGLTDVVAALCSQDPSQDPGLLFDDSMRRRLAGQSAETGLAALWKLMTEAIGKIFKYTPIWSAYYKDEDLKVWLRDALILAREITKERRIFQRAVSQQAGGKDAEAGSGFMLLSPSKMHP